MKWFYCGTTFSQNPYSNLLIALPTLFICFNRVAVVGMPTPTPPVQVGLDTRCEYEEDDNDKDQHKGGVETVFININNLNLNMSILLPPWSKDKLKTQTSALVLPVYQPAIEFKTVSDDAGPGNEHGAWTFIDFTDALYPGIFSWEQGAYQFLDVGSLRSQEVDDTSQVAESGHEQYTKETRENEATTTTLDDNVREVIDKNLLAAVSKELGESQKAPAGPTTSFITSNSVTPVLLLLPVEGQQLSQEQTYLSPQKTSRSVLGPGLSVACTAIGIGLALYSLGRTYRYLVPVWQGPFPFQDPFDTNSSLVKTWTYATKAVDGLNLETMFYENTLSSDWSVFDSTE